MEIKRKFEDVEIKFKLTDEEIIQLLSQKSLDERVVFFRKLFQTDMRKIFTLKFIKENLNLNLFN
jgi:hypothetical protein